LSVPLNVKKTMYGYRLDPLPSQDQLEDFYARRFYEERKPKYFKRRRDDSAWWMETYRYTLSALDVPLAAIQSALDFGCGPGFLAKYLDGAGIDRVIGFDPSNLARQFAREVLGVQTIASESECIDGGPYDLIVCWEVLEHLRNPEAAVILMREMLARHGRLLVVVPNDFNNLQARLTGGHGRYWLDATHCHYFSHAGIRRLMTEAGLDVVHQEATFPMEVFLLAGMDYIKRRRLGRACHGFRKRFESWLDDDERRSLYGYILQMEWGRESVIIARR